MSFFRPFSISFLSLAGLALVLTSLAQAAPSPYEEPIRYRRAAMVMIKVHYDRLSQMLKGTRPFTKEEFSRHASVLEVLSQVSLDGFVAGSHEGETKAKAEIWSDWKKFKAQGDQFRTATTRLREMAPAASQDALKSQLSEVTRSCKNCHDDFKNAAVGG